jgi:hypothetical protein
LLAFFLAILLFNSCVRKEKKGIFITEDFGYITQNTEKEIPLKDSFLINQYYRYAYINKTDFLLNHAFEDSSNNNLTLTSLSLKIPEKELRYFFQKDSSFVRLKTYSLQAPDLTAFLVRKKNTLFIKGFISETGKKPSVSFDVFNPDSLNLIKLFEDKAFFKKKFVSK